MYNEIKSVGDEDLKNRCEAVAIMLLGEYYYYAIFYFQIKFIFPHRGRVYDL